ncbi:hypothetical protein [Roseateles puraquae]|uniref:hypothetical protein n=1 Tax=Roseateles puraquae TaxID=431059 RepID=UPI0031DC6CE5
MAPRAKQQGGRHRRRQWAAGLTLAGLTFLIQAQPVASPPPTAIEGYPTELAEALLQRKQAEDEAIKKTASPGLFSFVATNYAWPNGTKLIVAFQGGNFEIWRDIATIAGQWSSVANISFDFGLNPVARSGRTYSPGDPPSVAQVRIDLTASDARLRWSAVGRQALQPEFNQATMQLGALAQTYPLWTAEDKADVLHEFGHVLGFLHEQQRPECKAEYRLEPGPNGEPTIFDVYLRAYNAPPNWTQANLLLANSYTVSGSAHPDKRSLFLYPTPDDIVPGTINGTKGPCYVREKNKRMSAEDIKRARRDYPFKPGNAFGNFVASNIAPLKALASTQGLSAMGRLTEKLERLELAARPLVYVQVAREEDRATGEQLRRALLQNRYVAPGVENIARKAIPPKTAEVRYFSPADQQVANDVAALATGELGATTAVPIKLVPRDTTKKQPLEIWLPAR